MKALTKWLSVVFLAVCVVAAGALVWQRQAVYDWWRLRDYEPSVQVQALAKATTMTDEGTRLFYVAHPQISEAKTFNQQCHRHEFSIVLGCYVAGGNIYLFDVQDNRLNGIKEVTAAHEMLHVAYERLTDSERTRIDALLLEVYRNIPPGRLRDTIAQYEAADPHSVPNELHSILGTELRDLPPELEAYYARYFNNRQAVVAFSEQYEQEFSRRKDQVAAYDALLATLRHRIEENQAQLAVKYEQLNAQQREMNDLRQQQNFAAYNSLVDVHNMQVGEYNALVAVTQAQIEEHNNLVAARNALAIEVQELVQSIDSTPNQLR